MKKRWLLVSLALLVPKIVTGETLNLNYEKPGAFDLEPRLGLQARACLSKADPMDIHFKFKPTLTDNFKVTLIVDGAPVSKSYAPFSSVTNSTAVAGSTNTDPDFQVPWKVSVVGGAMSVIGQSKQTIIGKSPSGRFCFTPKNLANNNGLHNDFVALYKTRGYHPTFEHVPDYIRNDNAYWSDESVAYNKKLFMEECEGKRIPYMVTSWPNPPTNNGGEVPKIIKDEIDKKDGKDFLLGMMFFLDKGTDDTVKPVDNDISPKNLLQELPIKPGPVAYTFPINSNDPRFTLVRSHGGVDLKLNNRNISSLTLMLTDRDNNKLAEWEWKATDGSPKNKLHLTHRSYYPVKPAGNDKSDFYQSNGFYEPEAANDVNGYYKGTLVSGSLLTQKYKDFINNIIPLSLPSDVQGDIDVVNTDSLTFIIGQEQDYSGQYVVSVSGKPLKFGPLIMDDNELMSAMQVRNACY